MGIGPDSWRTQDGYARWPARMQVLEAAERRGWIYYVLFIYPRSAATVGGIESEQGGGSWLVQGSEELKIR